MPEKPISMQKPENTLQNFYVRNFQNVLMNPDNLQKYA